MGPRHPSNNVTASSLFRGFTPGDLSETGFITFGFPQVQVLLAEVTARAQERVVPEMTQRRCRPPSAATAPALFRPHPMTAAGDRAQFRRHPLARGLSRGPASGRSSGDQPAARPGAYLSRSLQGVHFHEIQREEGNCAKLRHPALDADVAEVQLKDSNRGCLVCSMEPKKRQDIFWQARKTLSVGGG